MNLARYYREDSLTKLELENLYNSSTEKERIEITKEFNKENNQCSMPKLWGELSLKNESLQEKLALARYYKGFDKDIKDALENDKNILVRCALYQNPNHWMIFDSKEIFLKASQIEKLAIVRHPHINNSLILELYDINSNKYNLTDKEREEIIFAFCSNEEFIKDSKKSFIDDSFLDGMDAFTTTDFYNDLYDKAFEWHNKMPDITYLTFKTFSCQPDKKLEIYNKIREDENLSLIRGAIFESIPVERELGLDYNKLYKRGLYDKENFIRYKSAANLGGLEKEEVNNLLNTNDEHIIEGLMYNDLLSLECMNLVKNKIDSDGKLADRLVWPQINAFYERIRKKAEGEKELSLYRPENEDLENIEDFSKESYKAILSLTNYLNDKIEYLRKQLKMTYWIIVVLSIILIFFKR